MPDKAIAAILNRAGKRTGRGNGWTQIPRVHLRSNHGGIEVYREGERRERGEVTLDEAACSIDVSARRRAIDPFSGVLPARTSLQGRAMGDQGQRSRAPRRSSRAASARRRRPR